MKVSDMNKQQKIFTFVVLPIILLIAIIIVNIIFSGEEDNSQQETVIGLNTSLPQTTSNIQEQKIGAYKKEEIFRRNQRERKSDFVLGNYDILNETDSSKEKETLNKVKEQLSEEQQVLQSFAGNEAYDEDAVKKAKQQKSKPKKKVAEPKSETKIVAQQPRGVTFNSITIPTITNPKPNENSGISAYIHGDQTVHHGSLVKIRIGKNITLPNGERIPENTFVYGTCSVAGERMNIKVTRAQVGNKLLTCNLSAYGTDGNIGLHVPGSVQRQENKKASGKGLKKIGNVLGSGVNIATGGLAGSLAQTTTEGLIDAVADGSSKAVQQTKIFLPNNEQIYLI